MSRSDVAATIQFLGAARTVTGSRHLLEGNGKKVLVDCGLFQGNKETRQMNWLEFPFAPYDIDAVVITHAHNDHIGLVPRLVAQGYKGPIYATPATIGLARIILPDSARLQEEEARWANKHGSKHNPALPLFTERDAYECLKQFRPIGYHKWTELPGGMQWQYKCAGHILGSACAEMAMPNGQIVCMSGDLGRFNTPILRDPEIVDFADYLTIESTYGDRLHEKEDPLDKLERVLQQAWQTGGTVLIPSFAIGRTQEMMYYFRQLQDAGRMPRIPIYIDSPMAVSATQLYRDAKEEHDEDMRISLEAGRSELEPSGLQLVRDREQSKELNAKDGPMVIISGSGMANGGRIVHHLRRRLSDPSTMVLFTGFQAEGTLGRRLLEGEPEVSILGSEVPVRATVEKMNALSAHADQEEIMTWLKHFTKPPKTTFLVHGEPKPQEVLRKRIEAELGWKVEIPSLGDQFTLS